MMVTPAALAWINAPTSPEPHIAMVYRRMDGSMFYGCTWRETDLQGFNLSPSIQYRVRIRMKAQP